MLDKTNTQQIDGANTPIYQPVQPVKCISFSDTKERKTNMRYSMSPKLGLHRIGTLPVMQQGELAVVAGGPSLNKTYLKVNKFKNIMTCGSSHDHALSLGIKPTYHIECDPMKTQIVNYKREADCMYLIASRCHKSMFNRLKGRNIRLWHMWESDLGKAPYRGEPAFICGATVVLAAIPIALSLGFKSFHFFGFDSSFENEQEHHAYPQPEYAQMMTAKVGDPLKGKEFRTTATWIGQAQQFEEMRNNWGHLFDATIYGNGMIAEMEKYRRTQIKMQKDAK